MRRRFVLASVVVALGLTNALYFYLSRAPATSDEIEAHWVVYMPDLEAFQRENPDNILRSSHSNDPRYPNLYDFDGGKPLPIFSKIAGECLIAAYSIRKWDPFPGQMPDRLFLASLSAEQRSCVSARLPDGYQLAQLSRPTRPSKISWSKDLSDILVSSKANAQTH